MMLLREYIYTVQNKVGGKSKATPTGGERRKEAVITSLQRL